MIRAALGVAALVALGATGAQAAPAQPITPAFVHAVKDICVPNVMGNLPFNPPSAAQTAVGLILADPTAADELAPFKDLSPKYRIFGAVNSATGNIIVAADPSQHLCRVVVINASDDEVGAIQRGLMDLSNANGGWTAAPSNSDAGRTLFIGSIGSSMPLQITEEVPSSPSQGYGAADFIFTVVQP